MVLGGQTSGFSSSPFVGANTNFPVNNASRVEVKSAINKVNPSDVTKVNSQKPAIKEVEQHEVADKATQKYQDTKKVQDELKHEKAVKTDTFNSRVEAGKSRSEVILQQVATKHANDKEFKKQQAENFAQRLSNTEFKGKEAQASKEPTNTADKDQALTANVVQSQSESIDPDARAKKKLDDKLQKIYTSGGDKGKHFVSFVLREMTKGPLPKSILELVDGFLETLKPKDSMTPSEMIEAGNEPIITLRSMVSATDIEEQDQIRNSLANSTVASAGEKTDLLAIRNLLKVEAKQRPPQPLVQNFTKDNLKAAAEFVISINRGVTAAPWELAV